MKLVIVGDGFYTSDYVQYLREMAEGSEDIVFTGGQSGEVLEQLFSGARLFLQPSESEGLSIALLEAMGYGLTPVVSDIKENLEAIGSCGIQFENKNPKALAEKIEYLLSNPKEADKIGKIAKRRIENKYSWKIIARRVSRLYKNLESNKKK